MLKTRDNNAPSVEPKPAEYLSPSERVVTAKRPNHDRQRGRLRLGQE